MTGKDSFQVGSRDLRGDVVYDGRETLSITRIGKNTRYVARLAYRRTDQGATANVRGRFAARLSPSGEQHDETNADPDYLTVLNQPFSVQLDPDTLRDVAHLQSSVPFAFPSPMTGGALRGSLRRAGEATIGSDHALGIAFDARGPMSGAIPGHPEMALDGSIRMSGTAWYSTSTALLLALDATLTISGNLNARSASDPVTIVYRRTIRADGPAPVREAQR